MRVSPKDVALFMAIAALIAAALFVKAFGSDEWLQAAGFACLTAWCCIQAYLCWKL